MIPYIREIYFRFHIFRQVGATALGYTLVCCVTGLVPNKNERSIEQTIIVNMQRSCNPK